MVDERLSEELWTQVITDRLSKSKHDLSELVTTLSEVLPKMTEEQAIDFIKNRIHHFGIAEILDGSNVLLIESEGNFEIQYPVSDLLIGSDRKLRFTGSCHHIQKVVLAVLVALCKDSVLQPLKEWMSFSATKLVDYNHFFIGTSRGGNSGFKPSAVHVLDPSYFFTKLMQMQGSTEHEFKTAGSKPENIIEAQNSFFHELHPYLEIVEENGVYLASVGLRRSNGKVQILIALECIDNSNVYAPDRLIEMSFDYDHPEIFFQSHISKFVEYLGWIQGCKYSDENITLDMLAEKDKNIILAVRDKFRAQIQKLMT